jgi:hypothetical protein
LLRTTKNVLEDSEDFGSIKNFWGYNKLNGG